MSRWTRFIIAALFTLSGVGFTVAAIQISVILTELESAKEKVRKLECLERRWTIDSRTAAQIRQELEEMRIRLWQIQRQETKPSPQK